MSNTLVLPNICDMFLVISFIDFYLLQMSFNYCKAFRYYKYNSDLKKSHTLVKRLPSCKS